MKKKLISLMLSFALIFQTTSYSNIYADINLKNENLQSDSTAELNNIKNEHTIENELNKELRVIVELNGEPVIQNAIEKGIPYSKLSDDIIEKAEKKIEKEQEKALSDLEDSLDNKIKSTLDNGEIIKYDTSFNGFAITVKTEDINEIQNKPYVKNVYVAEEYERPQMKHSSDLIGTYYAHSGLSYKGEGTVVAIIDTGIDYTHSAMALSDETKLKYNQSEIEKIINENNLKGKFFTNKVPYGYNYYDHNHNTMDSYGYMHGMHVAGIVGANSVNGSEIDGIAPNAQLLALKVFSDDVQYPTTFTDIWLKAVDDAITLKADSINMSLGAAAGLVSKGEPRPEDIAIKRAKDAGILVAISAGNDADIMSGYYYKDKSDIKNPDTALIASPSLIEDSLSVASVDNTMQYVNKIKWTDETNKEKSYLININMNDMSETTGTILNVGNGEIEDYKNKDATNKIVMIELGKQAIENNDEHHSLFEVNSTTNNILNILDEKFDEHIEGRKQILSLIEKIKLAEHKKAIAVILYNDANRGEYLNKSLKSYGKLANIPLAIIGHNTYKEITKDFEKNNLLKLTLSDEIIEEYNMSSGKVSVFSSWGPTPDLRIKPEISAPGGYIYSTFEDDKYQSMSGTSMASPHIAGAIAIMKQHLNGRGIKNEEIAELIKLTLMNTAKPVENSENNIDFVRKQGAGLLQLDKALMSELSVKATGTNDDIQDGKLELKELNSPNFNAKLKIENKNQIEQKYKLSLVGIYEETENEKLTGKARNINNFSNINEELIIPPNSTKEFDFNIDFSNYSEIKKESFVEGYFILKDINSGIQEPVDMSIPFLAYYGDWSKPKAIDAFTVKEENEQERRTPQIFVNRDEKTPGSMFFGLQGLGLPIVKDTIYFSPDYYKVQKNNYYPYVAVRIAPLRNISTIKYSIIDEQTNEVLKVLGVDREVRKLSRLSTNPSYRVMPNSLWYGDINGKEVTSKDKLIYQMEVEPNGIEEKTQIYRYKLRADNDSPILHEVNGKHIEIEDTDDEVKKISFTVQDEGSGLHNIYLQSVYFVRKYPSTAPGEKPNPKDNEPADPKEIGDNPDLNKWKPQYGHYQKIQFVNSQNLKKSEVDAIKTPILKIKDGILDIPKNYVNEDTIYCDISGYENEKIQINTYYKIQDPYISFAIGDHLTNKLYKIVATGIEKKNYDLNFIGAMYSKAKISVNSKQVNGSVKVSNNAKVKIEFADKKEKLQHLKISYGKAEETLIKDYKLLQDKKEKYDIKENESGIEFEIKDIKQNISVTLTVKKVIPDSEKANISFEDFDFDKFEFGELNVNRDYVTKKKPILRMPKGKVELLGDLKINSGIIESVAIISKADGSKKILPLAKDKYDFKYSNEIYFVDRGELGVKFNLSEDVKVEVKFKTKENSGTQTNSIYDNSSSKNKKIKYPVVFLRSPQLLSIKTEKDINEHGVLIDGFVGYVGEGGLEKITISQVDEKGNVIGDTFDVPANIIKLKDIDYTIDKKTLYSGEGYEFKAYMRNIVFNSAIRIEAIAKDGQTASIVRRFFYDDEFPKLSYEILQRNLSDKNADIIINASDNSYKVNIYQNGSYIDGVDLSKKTLEARDVSYQKQFGISLKKGQNKIQLKVKDASNHETTKTMYIYRSEL